MKEISRACPEERRILGCPVHAVDACRALEYLMEGIDRGVRQFVVAQNPEKVMRFLEDEELSHIIETKATLLIPDGIGVVLSTRALALGHIPRVTGIGLFMTLLESAHAGGKRVFLYGSKPEVCSRLGKVVRRRYPGIAHVETQHGYEDDDALILQRICLAKPDFLFVALGSPKQEKWIARHLDQLPVECVMGVGGSFDVLAGEVGRAPVFLQRAGLEWLYRLVTQPPRAGRMRALLSFLRLVWKCRCNGRETRPGGAP